MPGNPEIPFGPGGLASPRNKVMWIINKLGLSKDLPLDPTAPADPGRPDSPFGPGTPGNPFKKENLYQTYFVLFRQSKFACLPVFLATQTSLVYHGILDHHACPRKKPSVELN